MSTFKDCLREVRDAAREHVEASHGSDTGEALLGIPRKEALVTIALVAIQVLEQELQKGGADDDHASDVELQSHLKACRKALKSHRALHTAGDRGDSHKKRPRQGEATDVRMSSSASSGAAAESQSKTSKSIELGQYASSGVFDQNEQKRMKFARLMGGVKAAVQEKGGTGGQSHHNTFVASNTELKRMNANLESQFVSAMSHKGKKGLGA
ncbi:hypothetical protein JKF63_00355 [Porcisia hertigi]|uniref:Small acidic protein n=1 Tax=Porcisia hertigi TaxID=2761500 RepID=A0A836KX03_9TRYP|nr:hypothetical protein JKF63_00355 [Porcisia hertigi]